MSQAPSSGRGRIFLSQELLSLMSLEIRPVREEDVEVVCGLIHALARYERLESHCKATSEQLREELFGPRAVIGCVLAWEVNEATGAERPVGFALYFYNFSTFLTRRGLYLEDLFVVEDARRRGYGKAIIRHLAQKALDEGCGRFDWSVLDWNQARHRLLRGDSAPRCCQTGASAGFRARRFSGRPDVEPLNKGSCTFTQH